VDGAATALRRTSGIHEVRRFVGFALSDDPSAPRTATVDALVGLSAADAIGDDDWKAATESLDTAVERFDVSAEAVRLVGDGWGIGVREDDVATLRPDDAVLAVISARVHDNHRFAFEEASARAVDQARRDPEFLGGCRLERTTEDAISLSCWRSARGARRYAYADGAHQHAKDTATVEAWVDFDTIFFATFRVLSARGSLFGAIPFAPGG
jgi:hypothetical protein